MVMEEKVNIAEILKDKPQGTKLYDLLRNIDVKTDLVSLFTAFMGGVIGYLIGKYWKR